LIRRKDKHGNEVLVEEPIAEASAKSLEVPAAPAQTHPRELTSKTSVATLRRTTTGGRISITLIKARGIAGTASGDVKPYIVLQTEKHKHRTHHAKQSEEPHW
jgi:hypothetical protein